jgi:peroxiredoxin
VLAPLITVTLHDGRSVELSELYRDRPVALVFLRHFGCIFCREQITQLRSFPNENIVLVSMAKIDDCKDFRERMESPQRMISDPLKTVYEQFGLKRGSFTQMFNSTTFKRGFEAMSSGNRVGAPVGDPWMLAGTFIINTDGEVVFSHFSRDASDNLSGEMIVQKLREFEKAELRPV